MSLQLFNLLSKSLFSPGQLGNQSFLLLNLTRKLTCNGLVNHLVFKSSGLTSNMLLIWCHTILCLQSCSLSIKVIELANVLIIFGLELT